MATLADLEKIQRRHLDEIFATHQVLTMMPPDPDSDRASLRLTIASSRPTFSDLVHGLAGVDLLWVDWERLFGIELPICPIYVKHGYRDAVQLVSRLLADDELTAEEEESAAQTETFASGESPAPPDGVHSGPPARSKSAVADDAVGAAAESAEQETPDAPEPDEVGASSAEPTSPPAAAATVAETTEPRSVAPSSSPPVVADEAARVTPVASLQRVINLIGDLDADHFAEPRNRRDFTERVVKALQQLTSGRRAKTRTTLEGLLSRTDGCVLRGRPDVGRAEVRDWLTDCRSQDEAYDQLRRALRGEP